MADISKIKLNGSVRNIKDSEARAGLSNKQNTINNNNKLSADLIDDTNATNKFATAAQLDQIETNKNNILSEQAKTTGMSEGGSNYITVGGIRVYVSATAPTGDIPDGSVGVGW